MCHYVRKHLYNYSLFASMVYFHAQKVARHTYGPMALARLHLHGSLPQALQRQLAEAQIPQEVLTKNHAAQWGGGAKQNGSFFLSREGGLQVFKAFLRVF